MLKQIFISSSSASFELENTDCYYAPEPYQIYLNGEFVREEGHNVFSLYGLLPDTDYAVKIQGRIGEEIITFHTEAIYAVLNVRQFYALGDGMHNDTQAIQAAILSCPKGGKVFIPKGIYLVTALFLKSDIQIELEKGATLLGEVDRHQFPVLQGFFCSCHVQGGSSPSPTEQLVTYLMYPCSGNFCKTFYKLVP